jgi:ribosomal protein S18 acetylase RimI-like enzyme
MKLDEGVVIRTASPDDLGVVQAIGCETYREHFSSIWSPKGLEEFLSRDFSKPALQKSLSSPQHTWLLVQDSRGSVVGYAKLNWDKQEPISGTVGAELQKIYFSASATGRGYGSRAIEHIVSVACKRDQAAIWLNVLASNKGAQRFYANAGFTLVGEIQFDTDIAKIEMAAMVRRLAADNSFEPEPLRGVNGSRGQTS